MLDRMEERALLKHEYEIAFLIAAELAVNPPSTIEEIRQRISNQLVNIRIKLAAVRLLEEWAQDVRKQKENNAPTTRQKTKTLERPAAIVPGRDHNLY